MILIENIETPRGDGNDITFDEMMTADEIENIETPRGDGNATVNPVTYRLRDIENIETPRGDGNIVCFSHLLTCID